MISKLAVIIAMVSLAGCGWPNPIAGNGSGLGSTTDAGACLSQLISGSLSDETPPERISQLTYDGRLVYSVSAGCCDAYNQVFDSASCQLLCAPSGGVSGAGDGRCSNFASHATNEHLVWERTPDAGTPRQP